MAKVVKEALKKAKGFWPDAPKDSENVLKEVLQDDDAKEAAEGVYMFWVMLGACQAKLGKAKEAENSYLKATKLEAGQAAAWKGLRDVYLEAKDPKKAVPVLHELLSLAATDEDRRAARVKILELVARYDAPKLASATVDDLVTKEVALRQTTGKQLATHFMQGHAADKALERLAAAAKVQRRQVYNMFPTADALVVGSAPQDLPEGAAGAEWAVQRAANYLGAGEDGEATAAAWPAEGWARVGAVVNAHVASVQASDAGAASVAYHVLRTGLAMIDWGFDDAHLRELAYALFPDDDQLLPTEATGTSETAGAAPRTTRRNRTQEEMALEVRQRLAGVLIAHGRVWAVVDAAAVDADNDADPSYLLDISASTPAGEFCGLADAADLAAPVRWLSEGLNEAPELIAPRCLLAALHYRLGDVANAGAAAVQGLGALALRLATGTLPAPAATLWGNRLAAIAGLALHRQARVALATGLVAAAAAADATAARPPSMPAITHAALHVKVSAFDDAAEALGLAKEGAVSLSLEGMDTLPSRKLTTTAGFRCEMEWARVGARVLCGQRRYDEGLVAVNAAIARVCTVVGVVWRGEAEAACADGTFDALVKCGTSCARVLRTALADLLASRGHLLWDGKEGDKLQCLASARLAALLDPSNAEAHSIVGAHHLSLQLRADVDGKLYTKADFAAVYPTVRNWMHARYTEKRVDPADGRQYTKRQFEAEYGNNCAEWDAATRVRMEATEDDRRAIDAFVRCLTIDPLHGTAGKQLCALLSGLGETRQLAKVARRIVAAAEAEGSAAVAANTWAFKLVAFQSLKDGRFDAASTSFRQCLRYIPRSQPAYVEVLYGLARAYEGYGQTDRALAQYRAITSGAEQAAVPQRVRVAALHGEAGCLVAQGEVWAAKELLLQITADHPDAEPSWSLLAQCHIKIAGNRTRACGDGAEHTAYRGVNVEEHVEKAMNAMEESLRCSRRNANALRLKGDLALAGAAMLPLAKRRGTLDAAAAAFDEVLDAVTGGHAAEEKEAKEKRAVAMYDAGRAGFALYTWGVQMRQQQQPQGEDGGGGLAAARAAPTDDESEAHREKAEGFCRRAIELLPRCAAFWVLLGCVVRAEFPNRRLYCLNKALQLDSRCYAAWCAQGWLWLLYAQPDSARMCFEKAKIIDPNAPTPWVGLGLCLQRKAFGNTTYDSRNCLEQAYQNSHTKETALLSLIAQHFHQPRQYGALTPQLATRALAVKEAFAGDAAALNTAGLVLEELDDLERAHEAFFAAERALQQHDKEHVLGWASGRDGVVLARNGEALEWSLVDAFTAYRMVLTSRLRVLCKLGKGSEAVAGKVAGELEALFDGDVSKMVEYESTTRAVLAYYMAARKYDVAAALLQQYLHGPDVDPVARDTVLAAVALYRTREPLDADGKELLAEFPVSMIHDAAIKRVCTFVDEVGRCLKDPSNIPDLTLAVTVPEKLVMFKVLVDAGEGPASVRYHDPTDGALIEFRVRDTGVQYTVAGEARPVFKQATLGVDDDGWYLEMPDIDTCVNLSTELGGVLPRLLHLFALGGVAYTDTATGPRAASVAKITAAKAGRAVTRDIPQPTALAMGVILGLVRDVLRVRGSLVHAGLASAVEVLWRFAGMVAALPERIPDVVRDLPQVIHQSVAILRRVVEDTPAAAATAANGGDAAAHKTLVFKAQYALASLLYAAPLLFPGQAKRWDEVVVVDPEDATAVAEADRPAGTHPAAGARGPASDGDDASTTAGGDDTTDDNALPALQWAAAILQAMASDGYAEASTLLGLVQYASGQYESAIATLSGTMKAGRDAQLDWRRWDCYQGVIYAHAMRGDYDAAATVIEDARGLAQTEQIAEAEAYVAYRRHLARGDLAQAGAVLAGAPTASLQTLMDQVNLSIGTDGFTAAQKRLMQSIPAGSYLRSNLGASLCVIEAWSQLKKDSEGMPVMTSAVPNAVMALVAKAEETWAGSVAARVFNVLVGILRKDPERSSAALDALRREVPGVDRSPLIHYWLSTVKDGVTCWDGLHTLLAEVGHAGADDAHLWFALKAVVEMGLSGFFTAFCPEVRPPDPTKLKGKEYREALSGVEARKQHRARQMQQLRGILRACIEGLRTLRPQSPYVAQKRKELDALV